MFSIAFPNNELGGDDDFDIISALKEWQSHKDFVLSNLSKMIINRDLLKIKIKNKEVKSKEIKQHINQIINQYNISKEEALYFVFDGTISNQAYSKKSQQIKILFKDGQVKDIVNASDHLNLKVLSKTVTKYYICFPKEGL